MNPSFDSLQHLLRQRIEIIADHAWRDRDAAAHLAALQDISEQLAAEHGRLRGRIPPRLNHFLTQASYAKALEFLEAETSADSAGPP